MSAERIDIKLDNGNVAVDVRERGQPQGGEALIELFPDQIEGNTDK